MHKFSDAECVAIDGDWAVAELGGDYAIIWDNDLTDEDREFLRGVGIEAVDEAGNTWYYSIMPDSSMICIIERLEN